MPPSAHPPPHCSRYHHPSTDWPSPMLTAHTGSDFSSIRSLAAARGSRHRRCSLVWSATRATASRCRHEPTSSMLDSSLSLASSRIHHPSRLSHPLRQPIPPWPTATSPPGRRSPSPIAGRAAVPLTTAPPRARCRHHQATVPPSSSLSSTRSKLTGRPLSHRAAIDATHTTHHRRDLHRRTYPASPPCPSSTTRRYTTSHPKVPWPPPRRSATINIAPSPSALPIAIPPSSTPPWPFSHLPLFFMPPASHPPWFKAAQTSLSPLTTASTPPAILFLSFTATKPPALLFPAAGLLLVTFFLPCGHLLVAIPSTIYGHPNDLSHQ